MLPVRGARGARGKRPFRRGEVSGAAVRSSEEIWEAYRRKPDGISTSLVFLTLHLDLENDWPVVFQFYCKLVLELGRPTAIVLHLGRDSVKLSHG